MPNSKHLALVHKFIQTCKNSNNFMRVMGSATPIEVDEDRVKVEFVVDELMTNPHSTLHGGCTATLIDIATTAACLIKRGQPGVSVDLHVSYLAAAQKGETVVLDSVVTKMGKSLAFTKADLYRKSDGVRVATGLHTKAFPPHLQKTS
ncbi:hypothetical protein WR25_12939 isoform A [Diploscapter pachys]|uniref:Acyl-coenzyme A thioesterase 13 n=1 Tax=Diploscapter pachys TaxID=2018661 RepID=A0A2A2LXI8_9BILA|nr:hypothetical protein WR25_12939 isoform A [Diploscapter pachys]